MEYLEQEFPAWLGYSKNRLICIQMHLFILGRAQSQKGVYYPLYILTTAWVLSTSTPNAGPNLSFCMFVQDFEAKIYKNLKR